VRSAGPDRLRRVRRSLLSILLVAAIWGASYSFIKVGLRELSWECIVFGRTALGAAVLLPLAARAGVLSELRPRLRVVAVVALVQITAPVALIAVGEQWITSGLAGLLNASVPIFVAVFAVVLDPSERVSGLRVAGIGLGLAGVALVVGIDVGFGLWPLLGALCLTLSSVGYAIGPLIAKTRLGGVSPLALVTGLMLIATAYTLPGALATLPAQAPSLRIVGAVFALGVVGTGLAFVLYYRVMQAIGPSRASVIAYLIPAFALGYGAAFLSERVTIGALCGLFLILVGSYLTARGRVQPAAA